MELRTAIELIEGGLSNKKSQKWCDLGCGEGLFSKALAILLAKDSTVYAIDKNSNSLHNLESTGLHGSIKTMTLDFVRADVPLENLDGILMANSLHFVKSKEALLKKLSGKLSGDGRFVIVEYEMTIPNPWVPYPVSFQKLGAIVARSGWPKPVKLAEVPSAFSGRNIYSALLSLRS